jgi:hypothetical protein
LKAGIRNMDGQNPDSRFFFCDSLSQDKIYE